MRVQSAQEIVFELEVYIKEKSKHGLVSDIYHQSVGLQFSAIGICKVDNWGKVSHLGRALGRLTVTEVVRAYNKAVKCLIYECETILRVDAAKI